MCARARMCVCVHLCVCICLCAADWQLKAYNLTKKSNFRTQVFRIDLFLLISYNYGHTRFTLMNCITLLNLKKA